jgi:hypothetical protein
VNNPGAGMATDVNWSISFTGGLVLLGRQTTGTINMIQPGFSPQIHSGLVFGVGILSLSITVIASTAEKTVKAFLVGPIVLVKK